MQKKYYKKSTVKETVPKKVQQKSIAEERVAKKVQQWKYCNKSTAIESTAKKVLQKKLLQKRYCKKVLLKKLFQKKDCITSTAKERVALVWAYEQWLHSLFILFVMHGWKILTSNLLFASFYLDFYEKHYILSKWLDWPINHIFFFSVLSTPIIEILIVHFFIPGVFIIWRNIFPSSSEEKSRVCIWSSILVSIHHCSLLYFRLCVLSWVLH